jgi:arylsulfatase A-like enzyme
MPPPLPPEWLEGGYRTLEASQRFWRYDRVWDDPEVVAQLRALYFGSLRFIDDQIGRLATYLRDADLWDETILVFTTDHGEMLGDQGLMTKGPKHYDAGIRVPLIVAGGGVTSGVSDRLTCTLDFVPTFCDWGGVEDAARPPLEGRSLAPVCAGEDDPAPWTEVSAASGGTRSVITADGWRLTRFVAEGRGQMFDLHADPDEQRNLYEDPAYGAQRQALLERLVEVESRPARMRQYRNLPVDEGHVWLTRPGGEHYLMEGPEAYPLAPSPYGRR